MDKLWFQLGYQHAQQSAQQSVRLEYLSIPKLNGCAVEALQWISNFIPHFIIDVITYPCWDWSLPLLVKWAHCFQEFPDEEKITALNAILTLLSVGAFFVTLTSVGVSCATLYCRTTVNQQTTCTLQWRHMSASASQITDRPTVCSTMRSGRITAKPTSRLWITSICVNGITDWFPSQKCNSYNSSHSMITSSNGNIFGGTGSLWGESTGGFPS